MSQHWQRTRTLATLGPIIQEFCNLNKGQLFTAAELRAFVQSRIPTAPSTADRVLRDMRVRGDINYTVVNRVKSLYQLA